MFRFGPSPSPIPQVDVITDGFDWYNAIIGTIGAFAAAVAIFIAIRAEKKADAAVTGERRRVFELDVLREIAEEFAELDKRVLFQNPRVQLTRYQLRLDMLTVRMPFWRLAMAAQVPYDAAALAEIPLLKIDTDIEDAWRKEKDLTDAWATVETLSRPGLRVLSGSKLDRAELVRESLANWLTDVPTVQVGFEPWQALQGRLRQELDSLKELRQTLHDIKTSMLAEAEDEFRRRLADELHEAIKNHVGAPPGQKPGR